MSAGSEREEENTGKNNVITARKTDANFVRNEKATSEGNSIRPRRLFFGHGVGIKGLVRTHIGLKSLNLSWEEDLDSTSSVYETVTAMGQINEDVRLKAIPSMMSKMSFLINRHMPSNTKPTKMPLALSVSGTATLTKKQNYYQNTVSTLYRMVRECSLWHEIGVRNGGKVNFRNTRPISTSDFERPGHFYTPVHPTRNVIRKRCRKL